MPHFLFFDHVIYTLYIPTLTHASLVTWAQRSSADEPAKNVIFLNINVAEVPADKVKIEITPTKISYQSTTVKGVSYAVDLELYGELDVENSKSHHSTRNTEFVLRKKETKIEYWPRLLKENKKLHFLKTDFSKVCYIPFSKIVLYLFCMILTLVIVGR